MIVKELSTGCGDLLLTSFYPTDQNGKLLTIKDPKHSNTIWGEGRYFNEQEQKEWLDNYLKAGPCYHGYPASGRAFIIVILNENQEKLLGPIFEQNGYKIIEEGVNEVHDSVLTLRAKVRKTKKLEYWKDQKAAGVRDIKDAKKEKIKNASRGTGKVLQRKVAVSASD